MAPNVSPANTASFVAVDGTSTWRPIHDPPAEFVVILSPVSPRTGARR